MDASCFELKGGVRINRLSISKVSVAYSILKDRILSGEYKHGQILSANALSQELQMSRTPILEAFKQLENEELVTVAPQIGVIVNPLNIENIRGRYVALSLLEGYLAGEAARIGTSDAKRKLQQLNDDIKQRIDQNTSFGDLNLEFHETIRDMTDNHYIKQLIRQMQIDYSRYSELQKLVFSKREYKLKSWQEHEDIVKAIIDGNVESARSLMEHHIYRSREQFLLTLLKEGSQKILLSLDGDDI